MLSRPLTAAMATPLVLSILAESESYGYEIICRVRELSEEKVQWKDGLGKMINNGKNNNE